MSFRALLTERDDAGTVSSRVTEIDDEKLPAGEVTVDIEWAGLNYKDGLCLTGAGGLVRTYPHVAGIDFAGIVRDSSDARYAAGQPVVLTGWRVGEAHWGGFSERARVKADWLVPLPDGLTTRQSMVMGTAGLTAMLALGRLEDLGVDAGGTDLAITGAAGGVGSIAVSLASRLGYRVAAISGRAENADRLTALGATEVIDRAAFSGEPEKPLESARWSAAIDTVGGPMLARILRQVRYGGAVAAVGNAADIDLPANVLPFILRGVTLSGIDSVMQPYARRVAAWQRIATTFDFKAYDDFVAEARLDDLPALARSILSGQVLGRTLVKTR